MRTLMVGHRSVIRGAWLVALGCVLGAPAAARAAAQDPVNPKASKKTRAVLKLLYDLPDRPDHKVISGQVLRTLDENPPGTYHDYADVYDRVQMIHDKFGMWVGIAGAEYSDWGRAWGTQDMKILSKELNPSLIAHSKKGGIVELHFHPLSPKNGFDNDTVTADDLLNPGQIHDNWMRLLNDVATGLRELRDNDVVVLWRPMHGGDYGWWWGGASMPPADYRRIWSHMVDYFSNARGLDNILYFQSWYGGGTHDDIKRLYAGDDNVDIVGIDHNATSAQSVEYDNILSFGKVFAISESWGPDDAAATGAFDMRRVIADIRKVWPKCAFFVQFDHPRYPDNHIAANRFGGEMLADPWILNAPVLGAEAAVDAGVDAGKVPDARLDSGKGGAGGAGGNTGGAGGAGGSVGAGGAAGGGARDAAVVTDDAGSSSAAGASGGCVCALGRSESPAGTVVVVVFGLGLAMLRRSRRPGRKT